MKPLGAKWIIDTYEHQKNSSIVMNRLSAAEIQLLLHELPI